MTELTLSCHEDDIRPVTPEESAQYNAIGQDYARIARALLTKCFHLMTGAEIDACQNATGDYDTDEGFNATLIDRLANQFPREISDHLRIG
jgi:hypothetical protein